MRLSSAIIFTVFGVLFQMTSRIMAQDKPKNSVIVKSDPPGAMVYFEGETSFVGITPFKLHPNFTGTYKILAFKSGYEKRTNVYFFTGNEEGVLRLKLSPKTRFKAALRSITFPGWGQYYSERKTSGILMNLLQVGTIIGTVVSVRDYNKAVDDYEKALKIYEENKKLYYLRDTYWKIVVEKHHKADDIFNRRQIWLGLTVGFWAYNILDSILFFPSFDKELFNRSVPTMSTNIQQGTATLTLTMAF